MVNHVSAFIVSIQNFTGDATSKDLSDYCKKWLDEMAEKLSMADVDRILNSITPQKYPAGYICTMAAKLPKIRAESDFLEFMARMDENILILSDVQIYWIQDIYCRFFRNVCDELLRRNLAIFGCRLFSNAILKLTAGSTSLLTNIHGPFFCLCLQARRFDLALPFFRLNVTEMFLSAPGSTTAASSSSENVTTTTVVNDPSILSISTVDSSSSRDDSFVLSLAAQKVRKMNLETRHVLTYFYYGALILAALERYHEALLMLEHCICVPARTLSAIVVEAFKKYVLISLLLDRYRPLCELPSYRSPVIQRQCVLLCGAYTRLADLVQKHSEQRHNVAHLVENFLEQKGDVFRRDQNYGLVKRVIIAAKENAIKRLGTVFISLHLNDVARLSFLNVSEAEEIMRHLCYQNRSNAQIDHKTKIVRFDLDPTFDSTAAKASSTTTTATASSSEPSEEDVERALREVIDLRALLGNFDDAVRLHSNFIYKNAKMSVGGPMGGGGMFHDDEGFHAFSGSPPLS